MTARYKLIIFADVLIQVLLIYMKLFNKLNCRWGVVMSPTWIPVVAFVIYLILAFVYYALRWEDK